MKILFATILCLLLLASCEKEADIIITAEQEAELTSLIQEFDQMSSAESEELRAKILDFYEVATVNNCDPGAFNIVTPEEILAYLNDIGIGSPREFHDWTVNVGMLIQDIIDQNEDCEEEVVINDLMAGQFANLSRATMACELPMFTGFANTSVKLAGTFGVYVAGSGFRIIDDSQLFLFGGAFNSFVRMQDLQDTCETAQPQ